MDSLKECLYIHSTNFAPQNPSYIVHTQEGLSLCVIRVFWSPVSVGRTYNNLWPSHTYKHIKILIAYCRPSHWRFCSQDGYFYSHWGGPIIWATSWSSETTVCNFHIQFPLPVDLQGGEGNSLGKSSVRLYWHLSPCNEFWPSDFAGKAIDISPLRCIIYHGFWPSDSAGRRYRYICFPLYYLSRILAVRFRGKKA